MSLILLDLHMALLSVIAQPCGGTALMRAIQSNRTECVNLLIERNLFDCVNNPGEVTNVADDYIAGS